MTETGGDGGTRSALAVAALSEVLLEPVRLVFLSRVCDPRLSVTLTLTLGACAGGETGGEGGSATFGPATTSPPTNATASAGTATDTASPDDDDNENDDDGESDGPESTTNGATDSGGSGGAATEDGTDSDSANEPSEQPTDGMYSDCLSAVECIGLTTCMTLLDAGGEVSDGFCTVGACMNAAASCDPLPGGTAVPFCFPIEQNGTADDICALDCSGGAECPAGMECYELSAGSICA